jgi:CRISPR/Cas system CMR-associated protein Cmr5 small subunit
VIGGLRFEEQINLKLARYLRDIDALLCQNGVLQATEFFYIKKKNIEIMTNENIFWFFNLNKCQIDKIV